MNRVYFIQPNCKSVIDQKNNYWFPYSAAVLWSWAIQDNIIANNYSLGDLVFDRRDIDIFSNSVDDYSVIAFSNYVWNWQYNQKLAERIKQLKPNCCIVAGGPQISNRPLETGFFQKYPYIDSIILGEGEVSFKDQKSFLNKLIIWRRNNWGKAILIFEEKNYESVNKKSNLESSTVLELTND